MNLSEKSYREYITANGFYNRVMDKIAMPDEDLFFRLEVQFLFEKALSDHVAVSAIELADDFHLNALLDFKNRAYELAPTLSDPEITMEFLDIYTDLRDKVFSTVPEFIENFISDFNKIFKTNGK